MTVTPKSTVTLHRITASSGPGARSELWLTRNFQASLGNYVLVDNPLGLVAYCDMRHVLLLLPFLLDGLLTDEVEEYNSAANPLGRVSDP